MASGEYKGLEFETIIDFCGSGEIGKQDGPRKSSKFNNPIAIVFDPHSNSFYVCDEGNNCIRIISHSGVVTTLHLHWNDRLKSPSGICINTIDNSIYISDTGNHRVLSVDKSGRVAVIAANKKIMNDGLSGDAIVDTDLRYPMGLAYDSANHILYVCDSMNHQLCALNLEQRSWSKVELKHLYSEEGLMPTKPCSVVVKDATIAVVREYQGDIIWSKDSGEWRNFGSYGADAGIHDDLTHEFYRPFGLCFDHQGNLFASQPMRQCIQSIILPHSRHTIIAPKSKKAKTAMIFSDNLMSPYGIACDSVGNLIICDKYAHKIKKLVRKGYTRWNILRLLWIAKKKNRPHDCLISGLPREVIFQVIQFLDAWSISEYDKLKQTEAQKQPATKKRKK